MAVAMIGPKFYAWDKEGKPLAFGKLYTYQARTNTPKDTYQSEDQIVANTNPVILNGEGYADVYLSGSYKMVLKDKDENEIWSSDPVTAQGGEGGEEWVNCHAAEYLTATSFKVGSNITDGYEAGRRVRIDNSVTSYSYSTIVSSVFSGGETTLVITDPVVLVGVASVCSSIIGLESTNGQSINDLLLPIEFDLFSSAKSFSKLVVGKVVNIKETTNDSGGGATWDVYAENTYPNDSSHVQHENLPLQLVLRDDTRIQQNIDNLSINTTSSINALGDSVAINLTNAIDTHNSDAAAHPALSAFITSEADRAEAAADKAEVSANIYADTAAGIAATAVGGYFSVPSAIDNEFIILYLHDTGGIAVEIKTYPSSAKIEFISTPDLVGYQYAVVDSTGRAVVLIKDSGGIELVDGLRVGPTLQEDKAAFDSSHFSLEDKNGNVIFDVSDSNGMASHKATVANAKQENKDTGTGSYYALVDSVGNVIYEISEANGLTSHKVTTKDVVTDKLNGQLISDFLAQDSLEFDFAEVNGVMSYGQSLSVGSQSTPPLSTTQDYDSIRFSSGVRTGDAGVEPVNKYTSIVPLIETIDGLGQGETPIAGWTQVVKEQLAIDGKPVATFTHQFLGTAPGVGGATIEQLSKGEYWYNKMLDDVIYSKQFMLADSKSYAIQGLSWMQGEANYDAETPKDVYKSLMAQLITDLTIDFKAITNQANQHATISYQCGSHLRYAISQGKATAFKIPIAQAQLEMVGNVGRYYVSHPMYQFDYVNPIDNPHITNTDTKVSGAYTGLAYKRIVLEKEAWKPLMPKAITRSGKVVIVDLHVPVPPIVFDTAWVTLNTNYGFRVLDSSEAELPISTVEIINGETIKITMVSDLALGDLLKIEYGTFTDSLTGEVGRDVGARGNVRDSQGDTIIFEPSGINRPLHNWLTMFRHDEGEAKWL